MCAICALAHRQQGYKAETIAPATVPSHITVLDETIIYLHLNIVTILGHMLGDISD